MLAAKRVYHPQCGLCPTQCVEYQDVLIRHSPALIDISQFRRRSEEFSYHIKQMTSGSVGPIIYWPVQWHYIAHFRLEIYTDVYTGYLDHFDAAHQRYAI